MSTTTTTVPKIPTGPGPELVPLPLWAQDHIGQLVQAASQDAFNTAFDSFVAEHIKHIHLNGKAVSRAQYKAALAQELNLEKPAGVTFDGVVSVPDTTTQNGQTFTQNTGLVGVFYKATYDRPFIILGAPAENITTASINVRVENDPPKTKNPPIFADNRRATMIDHIMVTGAAPITLPGDNKGN